MKYGYSGWVCCASPSLLQRLLQRPLSVEDLEAQLQSQRSLQAQNALLQAQRANLQQQASLQQQLAMRQAQVQGLPAGFVQRPPVAPMAPAGHILGPQQRPGFNQMPVQGNLPGFGPQVGQQFNPRAFPTAPRPGRCQ